MPRATRVYARLLDESTHPDVLREAGARQAVLDLLRTDAVDDPGRPGLAEHEIADLWTGDVPLFTTRPGTRDLWTSGGRMAARGTGRTGAGPGRGQARRARRGRPQGPGVDRTRRHGLRRRHPRAPARAPGAGERLGHRARARTAAGRRPGAR